MSSEIRKWENKELAAENDKLSLYLNSFGLPSENIIASYDDRETFTIMFPRIMDKLGESAKKDARYLSKFAIASTVGLFDAAVNYIWNEVIVNLRIKVKDYGLDSFYDAAIGGELRENYKDEGDLEAVKDKVLIDTCNSLELLSKELHIKLSYILTMRNQYAASHPNDGFINGSELISWLETCAKDVIRDGPSEDAKYVSTLIRNIKSYKDEQIDDLTVNYAKERLVRLSTSHIRNFVSAMFTTYVDSRATQSQRINILKYARQAWELASQEAKTSIAARLDKFREEADKDKIERASAFLNDVGGRSYESLSSKTIALNKLVDRLQAAHDGFDNFYTEPPIAKEIMAYINSSNDIPEEVEDKLLRTFLECRIGRGISYRNGVSPSGRPIYDKLFSLLDDRLIIKTIAALQVPAVGAVLSSEIAQKQLIDVLNILYNTAISSRLKEAIEFLQKTPERASLAFKQKEFKLVFDPLVNGTAS